MSTTPCSTTIASPTTSATPWRIAALPAWAGQRTRAAADVEIPARISVCRAPVSACAGHDCAPAHAGAHRDPVRWRHRVPAAQAPACRDLVGGARGGADLRAQATHAGGDAAALSGRTLCDGGRQATAAGSDETAAGPTPDHGVRAPGALRRGRRTRGDRTGAGPDHRVHRRAAQA